MFVETSVSAYSDCGSEPTVAANATVGINISKDNTLTGFIIA